MQFALFKITLYISPRLINVPIIICLVVLGTNKMLNFIARTMRRSLRPFGWEGVRWRRIEWPNKWLGKIPIVIPILSTYVNLIYSWPTDAVCPPAEPWSIEQQPAAASHLLNTSSSMGAFIVLVRSPRAFKSAIVISLCPWSRQANLSHMRRRRQQRHWNVCQLHFLIRQPLCTTSPLVSNLIGKSRGQCLCLSTRTEPTIVRDCGS